MHDPFVFRRQLALRILGLVGAGVTSLAACTGGGAAGSGGAASAASTGSASSSTAHAGTGGTLGASTTGGTGGMGGLVLFDASIGSGGSGGSAVPTEHSCFDWPPDGGFPMAPDASADAGPMLPFEAGVPTDACPTDTELVIYEIIGNACTINGWDPYAIVSGPTRNVSNQCCYVMDLRLCLGGGRPYLVDDEACLAALRRGEGSWGEASGRPGCDGLTVEVRAALARAWAEDALREHASVASFSRFSLELLAVGAPAGLVEQAHRAALDEIRHAELCFALASGYAGEALAPGPFPLGDGALATRSLAALAASTVKEGCIGETVAAVAAAEQLARATDPAVRAALEQIAADEARHAELAWRTVAWAVQTGGGEVRAAVARAFYDGGAETPPNPPGVGRDVLGDPAGVGRDVMGDPAGVGRDVLGDPAGVDRHVLEAHGRLDAATMARVVASALVDVVGPSARALLGAPAVAPAGRAGARVDEGSAA